MIAIKSRAEERSAKVRRQRDRIFDERDEALSERAEKTARLRSLRLDKEDADKKDAEQGATGDVDTKKRPRRAPPQGQGRR